MSICHYLSAVLDLQWLFAFCLLFTNFGIQHYSMKVFPVFFKFIRNKYVLATIFFVIWMFFFDHNNIFIGLQYRKELKSLTDNKKYYKAQIEKTQKELLLLSTTPFWIEKVAREQYLMKREGEDIFVIKEDDK